MKSRSWYLITVSLLAANLMQLSGAGQSSAPGAGSSSVTLTLSSTATNHKIGAPMIVTVTMTNNGKSDYVWEAERPDPAYRNFRFQLTTSRGDDVVTTAYHRKITGKQLPSDPAEAVSGSSMFATLRAGQSVQFTVDLTKLYQIERPGTYTLVVARREDPLNKLNGRSKPLQIDIVP